MLNPNCVDGPIDLYAAVVRVAIEDYRRGPGAGAGPGSHAQQQNYATARDFLDRAGLLDIIDPTTGKYEPYSTIGAVETPVPRRLSSFWQAGSTLTDVQAWRVKEGTW